MNSQRELAHQMVRASVDELEKLLRRGSGGNLYLYIDIYYLSLCISFGCGQNRKQKSPMRHKSARRQVSGLSLHYLQGLKNPRLNVQLKVLLGRSTPGSWQKESEISLEEYSVNLHIKEFSQIKFEDCEFTIKIPPNS